MIELKCEDKSLRISTTKYSAWCAEYSNCNVMYEIEQANRWLADNPSRMWKTLKGMERWLERADRQAAKNPRAYQMKSNEFIKGAVPASESYWAKREKVQEETNEVREGRPAADDVVQNHLSRLKDMLRAG